MSVAFDWWKPIFKCFWCWSLHSLRKQPTFGDATNGFSAKWHLRNDCRNFIPMTHHYPDLGSASDWLNQISHAAQLIWSTTHHQYGISALVSQMSFGRETSGSVTKFQLSSQVKVCIYQLVTTNGKLRLLYQKMPRNDKGLLFGGTVSFTMLPFFLVWTLTVWGYDRGRNRS